MHGPYADEYRKPTITEVETLEDMNAREVVDYTEDMNALQSTWAFKLKLFLMDLLKVQSPFLCQGRSG